MTTYSLLSRPSQSPYTIHPIRSLIIAVLRSNMDPNVFAILTPTSPLALEAIRLPENRHCFRAGSRAIAEHALIGSGDSTPEPEASDDVDRIELLFNNSEHCLDDRAFRWQFGTNPVTSYVLLGHPGTPYVSRLHFSISLTPEYHIVFHQLSERRTIVSHNYQPTVLKQYAWVLLSLPPDEPDPWHHIHILVGRAPQALEFKIVFPNHKKPLQDEYLNNLRAFVKGGRSALPSILDFKFHSIQSPTSSPYTPVFQDFFHVLGIEGKGSYGVVEHVVSLRNGESFARKLFFKPGPETGKKRRRRDREEWLSRIRNEVDLMKNNSHPNIIQVIDYEEWPIPTILMPYYPHGSIVKFAELHSIYESQYLLAFFQLLTALDHLHSRGVAHRDVKPENILVAEVDPFTIVLSDFGISKAKSRRAPLTTFCGTEYYAAPEVFPWRCPAEGYSVSVDIWSAGVIMLDWAFGHPKPPRWTSSQKCLERWWRALVRMIDGCDPDDEVLDILEHMVVMEPKDRFSARQCLEQGYQNGLFYVREDSQGVLVRARTCEDDLHDDSCTECSCHHSDDDDDSSNSAEAPVKEALVSSLETHELEDSELYLPLEAASSDSSPARKRRKLAPPA